VRSELLCMLSRLADLSPSSSGPAACFPSTLLVRPFRLVSELLPNIKHINQGVMGAGHSIWARKFDILEEAGSSVLIFSGLLPTPALQGIVGDADAAQALFNNKLAWGKPIEDYT